MELVGYSCRHPEPPLRHVHLSLGSLTVLLGSNDAGKSSLLRAVARDLDGGHYGLAEPELDRQIGSVFFALASEDELRELVGRLTRPGSPYAPVPRNDRCSASDRLGA